MGIFSRLFGSNDEPEKDPLYEKVRNLVSSAHILAVSSLKNFKERHQKLSTINSDDWDFFVTVAAICYALMGLADSVSSEPRYNKLSKIWHLAAVPPLKLPCARYCIYCVSISEYNIGFFPMTATTSSIIISWE